MQCAQVAFTKPCLVKGIVRKASLEVCTKRFHTTSDCKLYCACEAAHVVTAISHQHAWLACRALVPLGEGQTAQLLACKTRGLRMSQMCEVDRLSSEWSGLLQGMRDSYGRLRQHLLEHLEIDFGSQRLGNVRRPAVQQLLLLLLLGAILLLAVMVSAHWIRSRCSLLTVRQLSCSAGGYPQSSAAATLPASAGHGLFLCLPL